MRRPLAQGLVLQRFAEARTSIDAFKAELFEKLDGLEARLVRIEQRMSTFEGRQPRFEADLPEIGRMVRERL